MLGRAYLWNDSTDGSYLSFNAGCVARVKVVDPDARGLAAEVQINHFGRKAAGRAGSVAQGKRFVEEWIAAQSRRMMRGPPRRAVPPSPAPRERTPAEIREWQRREAEHSARMMREAGWRESPSATERSSSKPRGHRNWSWSP